MAIVKRIDVTWLVSAPGRREVEYDFIETAARRVAELRGSGEYPEVRTKLAYIVKGGRVARIDYKPLSRAERATVESAVKRQGGS